MNKRPDQHQIDPDEARATDYKSRRQTEDQNRRGTPQNLDEANRATTQTPNEAMESRRQQSQADRESELDRAREAHERNEGRDGDKEEG